MKLPRTPVSPLDSSPGIVKLVVLVFVLLLNRFYLKHSQYMEWSWVPPSLAPPIWKKYITLLHFWTDGFPNNPEILEIHYYICNNFEQRKILSENQTKCVLIFNHLYLIFDSTKKHWQNKSYMGYKIKLVSVVTK